MIQAIFLLPLIDCGLTFLGYARMRAQLEKKIPLGTRYSFYSAQDVVLRSRELAGIVSLAAQHGLWRATCLRRSLLTWLFLRREGIQGQIRFGVRLVDRQLEAHAWVEYEETIVNDSSGIRSIFQTLENAIPPTNRGL